MSLYGMVGVSLQFNLDKLRDNIEVFKSTYGVSTEQEVYERYLADMSIAVTNVVKDVEGIAFEAGIVGIHDESMSQPVVEENEVEEQGEPAEEPDKELQKDVSEDSIEVDGILDAVEVIQLKGFVTQIVVNENNPRFKNYSTVAGIPVEKAEMAEDFYLKYEEYGTGEEKYWSNIEGEDNK